MDDQLFAATYYPEWYYGGELSSCHSHDSVKPGELPYCYILFCYPRDFTPVCTGELIALQQALDTFRQAGVDVLAGSTDSPEAHNLFFNDEAAFPPEAVRNIEYPVLTLGPQLLTKYGRQLILDEFGYAKRVAIGVIDGVVQLVYQTNNDTARDIHVLSTAARQWGGS